MPADQASDTQTALAADAHIRSIGTDILSPEGDRRVVLAVLDIQSHPTISPDAARTLRQGLDKPDG